MKIARFMSFVFVIIMIAACFTACPSPDNGESKKMTIKMWVSDVDGMKDLVLQQVEAFKQANGYDFEVKIEGVSEADSAGTVLADLDSAPDIYWFAGDRLPELVRGKALAKLGVKASEEIRNTSDEASLTGATVDGELYAYPLTSDNGYFLWYDTRYISAKQAETLEGIIEACKEQEKLFGFNLGTAWMMSSFFFAQPVNGGQPLCTSSWEFSKDGKFTGFTDTFNTPNGLIAMKGMQKLTSEEIWIPEQNKATGTAAIVTGVFNRNNVRLAYGDENLAVTKLPTYTVDGKTYQLGSYMGCKYIGVKPQADDDKAVLCAELAMYLSSEEAQLDRFYDYGWGPSNLNAQQDSEVKKSPYLKALAAQNKYAQVQGVIPGQWWATAALLTDASYKNEEGPVTDATMQAALEKYAKTISEYVTQ